MVSTTCSTPWARNFGGTTSVLADSKTQDAAAFLEVDGDLFAGHGKRRAAHLILRVFQRHQQNLRTIGNDAQQVIRIAGT